MANDNDDLGTVAQVNRKIATLPGSPCWIKFNGKWTLGWFQQWANVDSENRLCAITVNCYGDPVLMGLDEISFAKTRPSCNAEVGQGQGLEMG